MTQEWQVGLTVTTSDPQRYAAIAEQLARIATGLVLDGMEPVLWFDQVEDEEDEDDG